MMMRRRARASTVRRFILALVLGGTGEEIRDWCDVRDVVRLLAMLAQSPQAESFRVINGGSGQPMRVSEVANLLAGQWGDASVRFSGNVWAGDPFSLLADDTALRATGFAWRIAPAEGIADYVRWFRDRARG